MPARQGARGRDAPRSLVWLAGALVALASTLAVVAPRDAREPGPAAAGADPARTSGPAASLRSAAPSGTVTVARAATAPERAPRVRERPREAPATDAADAHLEILVTDAGGRPAAGARIELLLATGELADDARLLRAGADGRLALAVAPGSARAVAWTDAATALPASAALVAGETAHLALVLEPAYPVAGRVTDAATGAPIAGARVAFWTYAEGDAVATAADGTFRHPRFPAAAPAQQVCASAAGYARSVRYLRVDAGGGWKLSAAAPGAPASRGAGTPWIELELHPELRITGRLVDWNGRPVVGARVAAEGFVQVLASVASRDRVQAESDADGAFELAGLRPDVAHVLTVAAPGLALAPRPLAAHAGTLALGDLALAPSALVAGAVVDAAGVPVAGAEVVLRERCSDDAARLELASARLAREHRTRTGPDGAFALEGFLAGPVTLSVDHAGAAAELELVPRSDRSFDSPVITLFPPPLVADGEPR